MGGMEIMGSSDLGTVSRGGLLLGAGVVLTKLLEHLRRTRSSAHTEAMDVIGVLRAEIVGLTAKNERLDLAVASERALCDAKLATIEEQRRADRNEFLNLDMKYNNLLLVIELAPDRIPEAVARIRASTQQMAISA